MYNSQLTSKNVIIILDNNLHKPSEPTSVYKQMSSDKYLLCEYCGELFPKDFEDKRHDTYPDGCPNAPNDDDETYEKKYPCFSCNSFENAKSNSQKTRGWKGRCNICVKDENYSRYKHFPCGDVSCEHPVSLFNDAICNADIEKVKEYISAGIDPNVKRQLWEYDHLMNKYHPIWKNDGSIYEEVARGQPTTPLKLVVFRISDSFLEVNDLQRFKAVAELLVDAGADKIEAIAYARSRYSERGNNCENLSPHEKALEDVLLAIK